MTTKVIKTVGSTGDYSLWQSAEDASPTDLTAVDQIYSMQGLAETFTAGAGVVLVSVAGQTVDANRYIELTSSPSASFQVGSDTHPLRADPAYGCYLTSAQDFKAVVSCATNYTHISALMIVSTASSGGPPLDMGAGASGTATCDVNACIIEGIHSPTTGGLVHLYGSGQVIRNSLVTLLGSGQGTITCMMNGAKAYGCTLAAASDLATKPTYINVGAYGAPLFQNCALFGATNMSTGGAAPTFGTCKTDIASPPGGCTTAVYADCFVNTTAAARDFRDMAGSPLIGAAAVDATYETGDIRNQIRGSSPDIGAYQFVASNDVTIQLSGMPLALAQGQLAQSHTLALTGMALSLGQGDITVSNNGTVTIQLTGMAMAMAQGSVSTVHIVNPVGLGLTLNQGQVGSTNDVTVQLTGMGMSLGQGQVAVSAGNDITIMLTGMALSLGQGAVQAIHTVELTGLVVDLKQGTLTASGGTQSIWSDVTTPTATWTNAD